MRSKAQSFLPGLNLKTVSISHGGELAKGRRKTARPIDPKQALHVVLRSTKAKGKFSLLHPKNAKRIQDLTSKLSKRWGIHVYRYANVGNHLHLLVKASSRAGWKNFSRELAGGIAMIVTRARKGSPLRFWDHLIFTRIVRFGKDFDLVTRYVIKNLFEGAGIPAQGKRVHLIRAYGGAG